MPAPAMNFLVGPATTPMLHVEHANVTNGAAKSNGSIKPKPAKLTDAEKRTVAEIVAVITGCKSDEASNFQKIAQSCYHIQRDELYREYPTQEAFFKAQLGFSRSHSLRLAQMGELLDRVSPAGDMAPLLVSDAHLRPVLKLTHALQDAVLAKASSWSKMAKYKTIPAKLVAAVATFLNPPAGAREPKDSAQSKLVEKFREAIEIAKSKLPADTGGEVMQVFKNLIKTVKDIGKDLRRSTGIGWTEKTWNPLHGCSRASKGCDRCYAAKQTATRLADVYPGLAVQKTSADGKVTYAFTGKIQLAPEELAEPLLDHEPRLIFVNSMSDLFHPDVPEEFIDAVFTVMELAHWHTFQVVTKRPERAADYTLKRYADKEPPTNIWLGTSTEDQAAYDERMPHLKRAKAAVRFLSVEPLLGPIKFGSMDGLGWVIVGGESGHGARPMAKVWAMDIRDACKESDVPFYFKQWGAFNELGQKEKVSKNSGPATLDGVVHQEYPNH